MLSFLILSKFLSSITAHVPAWPKNINHLETSNYLYCISLSVIDLSCSLGIYNSWIHPERSDQPKDPFSSSNEPTEAWFWNFLNWTLSNISHDIAFPEVITFQKNPDMQDCETTEKREISAIKFKISVLRQACWGISLFLACIISLGVILVCPHRISPPQDFPTTGFPHHRISPPQDFPTT